MEVLCREPRGIVEEKEKVGDEGRAGGGGRKKNRIKVRTNARSYKNRAVLG